MSTKYELPELGEEVESAEVVGVLVSSGDEIEKDQSVIEVETDKATVEIPSPASGRVVELLVEKGDTIRVGQEYIDIESDGAAGSEEPESPESSDRPREREEAEEEKEEEEEGEEERAPGAESDDGRDEEEEDGAGSSEKEATPGEDEAGHAPRVERSKEAEGTDEAEQASRVPPAEAPPRGRPAAPAAAPSVRRFAREIGVDVARVTGSGPGGRISIADVKAYARRSRELRAEELSTPGAPALRVPDEEDVELRSMTRVRRTIARRMLASWTTIPHVTLHSTADVASLERAMERHAEEVEEAGGKLSITPVLLKVLAAALKAFPEANSRLDEGGDRILLRRFVHLGVAVDTDRGLLVPVLRDADRRGLLDLAVELRELAEKARAGRLTPDDMSGACAALTNLGGLGVEGFTPLIVPGQAVVLGAGRIETVPAFVDDRIEPRRRLPLSLSFDHRLLDGADAARFLRWIVRALEDPLFLALER